MHPWVPLNGPDDQLGLAYWDRRGAVLLVFVNTNFSALGGSGHVEHQWLDQVLTDQADARIKFVVNAVMNPTNNLDVINSYIAAE